MLIDSRITEYLGVLKSEAPAPGGGAVAALTGAQGAALIMMVANLTIGKKKYEEFEELNISVREEADEVLAKLMCGVDEDKDAFEVVSAAYAMPKATDEEKAARKAAIAEASLGAAMAPLNALRAALRGLELTISLVGKSNKNLISDLYVAALNLNACIQAAKLNVLANTPYIVDRELAESMEAETAAISTRGAALAEAILAYK